MINICVWSHSYVEIENEKLEITTREDILKLIMIILDKSYYSGERICLESVDIDNEQGKNLFTEIRRW